MYLDFADSQINLDEDGGAVSVCLVLGNVSEPTQSGIWADIESRDSSAMGKGNYSILFVSLSNNIFMW